MYNYSYISLSNLQYLSILTFQETYPGTPPVWFADSEETSVTNAVQILSNTEGRDNHVIHQVAILLRELCRLHAVPEPPDIDSLTIPVLPVSRCVPISELVTKSDVYVL